MPVEGFMDLDTGSAIVPIPGVTIAPLASGTSGGLLRPDTTHPHVPTAAAHDSRGFLCPWQRGGGGV
jgi:hypothetical protein